jgi:hypothetical protein
MFTMEVPYVTVQDAPIVMAQATASGATTQPDYLLKTCEEVPSVGGIVTAMNLVDPADSLAVELLNRNNSYSITSESFAAMAASIKANPVASYNPRKTDSPRNRLCQSVLHLRI